jgi:hypothetical protein
MQRAKSMPGKATVTLAGEDIIDKPIVKPNVQKLRYATNCHYLVVMIQFHLVLPQFGSVFFWLFFGFFVTENAVIDITIHKMVTNIAPLHTFQI